MKCIKEPRGSLVGSSGSATAVTLLSNGELDTLALGKRDPGLLAGTDDEDVGLLGGEDATQRVLDVDDLETTNVALTVNDKTDTTNVTTASGHGNVASLELDKVDNLVVDKVEADGVVGLDQGVGVADGATVVGDDIGDTLLADQDLLDTAELVLGLLIGDAVDGEATLDVVDQTEVLASLLDADDVHETSGEGRVSADLVVDLDKTLHEDRLDLAAVQSILQAVAQEDDQGKTLASFVGTGAGLRGVRAYTQCHGEQAESGW